MYQLIGAYVALVPPLWLVNLLTIEPSKLCKGERTKREVTISMMKPIKEQMKALSSKFAYRRWDGNMN